MANKVIHLVDEPDEILDLVNDSDDIIGLISRSDFGRQLDNPPGNIRASEAFIVNDSNQLWIPRRSPNKVSAPNGLDFSVAEHVGKGEAYETAIVRGFAEELNMSVKTTDLELVDKLWPIPGLPVFRSLYILWSNQEPDFNRADYASFHWIGVKAALQLIESGTPAKNSLQSGIIALQKYLK